MSVLTDDECREIWMATEPTEDRSHSLVYARAIESAVIARLAQGVPDLVDSAKDEHGHCIMCGIHPASVQAYITTAIAATRVQAINECADTAKNLFCFDAQGIRISSQCEQAIRDLIGGQQT